MNNFDPNIKPTVVYLCPNTGIGISVEAGKKPSYIQETFAIAMVSDCEENRGSCPKDCQIRMLAERRI